MKTGEDYRTVPSRIVSTNLFVLGHVERTNDRDYEVEERYVFHISCFNFCTANALVTAITQPQHGTGVARAYCRLVGPSPGR